MEPRALTLSKGLVPFVTDGCRPVPSGSATCGQALLETTTTLSLEQLGIPRQEVSPDPSVNSMLFIDLNEAFAASSGLGTAFLFASPTGGLRRASDIFGRTTGVFGILVYYDRTETTGKLMPYGAEAVGARRVRAPPSTPARTPSRPPALRLRPPLSLRPSPAPRRHRARTV